MPTVATVIATAAPAAAITRPRRLRNCVLNLMWDPPDRRLCLGALPGTTVTELTRRVQPPDVGERRDASQPRVRPGRMRWPGALTGLVDGDTLYSQFWEASQA